MSYMYPPPHMTQVTGGRFRSLSGLDTLLGLRFPKAAAECDALLHNVNCVVLSAAVECDALLLQHNLVRSKMSVLEAERDRSLEEVGALHSQVRLLEESKEHYFKVRATFLIKTLHAQVSSLAGQKKT